MKYKVNLSFVIKKDLSPTHNKKTTKITVKNEEYIKNKYDYKRPINNQ